MSENASKQKSKSKISKKDGAGKQILKGKDASLASRGGMGGIIGGEGYEFQTRYILSLVPRLLADATFTQLLPEGSGDVDLQFLRDSEPFREHVQVKNHIVDNSELKSVIEIFNDNDRSFPDTYSRFTLACPDLLSGARTLATRLKRLRNAKPFFDEKTSNLDTTYASIKEIISRIGLSHLEDFIIEKVHFRTGLPKFEDKELAGETFSAQMQKLGPYRKQSIGNLEAVYTKLFEVISASRGVALSRGRLKELIEETLQGRAPQESTKPEKAEVIDVALGVELEDSEDIKIIGHRGSGGTSPNRKTSVFKKGKVIRGKGITIIGTESSSKGKK